MTPFYRSREASAMRASVPVRPVEHGADRAPEGMAGVSPGSRGFTGRQDLALTAMLVLLCMLLFVTTPLVALGLGLSRLIISLVILAFGLLVIMIARGRTAAFVAWSAAGSTAFGAVLVVAEPFQATLVIVHSVNLV